MRFALALLLFGVPLAVAAPVPKAVKAKLPDYYPLTDGAIWEYEMGAVTLVVKATEVTEKDGVRTAKLVREHDGKEVSSEGIHVDKDGVFRTHVNGTEIKPPVLLLKFGLADEESWEVKSGVDGGKVAGKFTLAGASKVTVPAGEYEAVLVRGDCTIAGTKYNTRWWIAEGVGIVKLEHNVGGTPSVPLELKKYTPGKAK